MEEERAVGLSCALEMFKETEEIAALVDELRPSSPPREFGSPAENEAKAERFKYVVEQYREQPHLIDPHLPKFLDGLVAAVRKKPGCEEEDVFTKNARAQAFRYIFILVGVRGFKQVVRHLPHEVSDLVPVLEMLEADLERRTGGDWEAPYVCLLWMSIIILLPFPMGRLDSGEEEISVMLRIMRVLKAYLVSYQSTSLAAGFLASKFLTRPDVMQAGLEKQFFDWAVETMKDPEKEEFLRLGALRGLNQVYKHGKREDLYPFASSLLREVVNQEFHKQTLALRLMSLKLIQRIGLVFLKPKIAKWRYQRGCRSLLDSFQSSNKPAESGGNEKNENDNQVDDDEDYELHEDVEEVIDQLLMGLKDADSQVRWSSAKGVGRVTGRLPKYFADDVIGSLLDFFSLRESDSAWHGGCLALAELGRRGFLLPARLPEVVRVVLKALVFDEARGYYSVGINVRDAACYVVWSFARAYEPAELAPFVQDLASTLLVVCCFDREVKGRVAASAAFQENVGRVGSFPHGIEILTTADFVSVANRKNAFLNISTYIAGFEEYRDALLSHLVERKVRHWDANIRDLASKALHSIGQLDPPKLKDEILPDLLKGLDSPEINEKHGSLLSLAESVHALAKVGEARNQTVKDILGDEMVETLTTVLDRLEQRRAFRLMGAHLMREASSLFVLKCSESHLPLDTEAKRERWLQHLYSNLTQAEASVREAAARGLAAFCRAYVHGDEAKVKAVVDKCIHEALSSKTPNSRMGFSFAIGEFESPMMPTAADRASVFGSLASAFRPPRGDPEPAMILARRDALDASRKLVANIGVAPDSSTDASAESESKSDAVASDLFDAYLDALTDYTIDKPGDVGAWVRQAGLDALLCLVEYVVRRGRAEAVATPELGVKLVCAFAKQACERIDKVRLLAAKNFVKLIYSGFPNLPRLDDLRRLFPEGVDDSWSNNNNFAQFVDLVRFPEIRKAVLSGLVFSIGDVGQKASQVATDCTLHFLRDNRENRLLIADVFAALVEINEDGVSACGGDGDDRLVSTVMPSWDKLLSSGAFDDAVVSLIPECPLGRRLAAVTKRELVGRRVPVGRLVSGAGLWCCLALFRDPVVRRQAFCALASLLGHRYPRVRKVAADQMYETLATAPDGVLDGDDDGERLAELLSVLSETAWSDEPDVEVKAKRDRICELLGVPIPVLKKRVTPP